MSLASFAAELSGLDSGDLDGVVLEAARQRLFDTLACCVAGASTPEGQILGRLAGQGSSTGGLIRCAAGTIRSTELDDIHIASCTTPGSIAVPAAVFAAAEREADDRDLLCGLVAGYEAMARLGCAVDGASIIYRGIWTTYLCAPFAAAAAVARIFRLGEEQTAHALAIAASRSTGMNARSAGHASSRWYMAGCAGAEGYLAARAAELGMAGDPGVLDRAFPRAAGVTLDPELPAADGGWLILDVDAKPFRTSMQALAATQAFLRLLESHPDQETRTVRVWAPAQVKAMIDNPAFPLGVQRQLAMAVGAPRSLWDVAHPRPADPGFAAKIQVLEDERLTRLYPSRWGGRVEITWRDGAAEELEVLDPPGSARAPLGWDGLLHKHREVAAASGLEDAWLEPAANLCRSLGATSASHAAELAGLFRRT